jgi:hypothetical protein
MITIVDVDAEVERRAAPRRTQDIRKHGKTDAPRVELECINDVIAELIEKGREEVAAAFLTNRDYVGFWKDSFSVPGIQSLLERIADLYEKRGDKRRALDIWYRVYEKRKGEILITLPAILDMRKQLTKGIHLDTNAVKGSEANYHAIKEYVLAAGDLYLLALKSLGLKQEAEQIASEIAAIVDDRLSAPAVAGAKVEKWDDGVFWDLIEEGRNATGSGAEMASYLASRLQVLRSPDIIKFQKMLHRQMDRALRWDLWGVACIMMRGDCSEDAFEYFRAWLVSRGRVAFEEAICIPEAAATGIEPGIDVENEAILYAALNAYIVKNKGRGDEFAEKTKRAIGRVRGTAWTVNDLPRVFPKLCERFRFGS